MLKTLCKTKEFIPQQNISSLTQRHVKNCICAVANLLQNSAKNYWKASQFFLIKTEAQMFPHHTKAPQLSLKHISFGSTLINHLNTISVHLKIQDHQIKLGTTIILNVVNSNNIMVKTKSIFLQTVGL